MADTTHTVGGGHASPDFATLADWEASALVSGASGNHIADCWGNDLGPVALATWTASYTATIRRFSGAPAWTGIADNEAQIIAADVTGIACAISNVTVTQMQIDVIGASGARYCFDTGINMTDMVVDSCALSFFAVTAAGSSALVRYTTGSTGTVTNCVFSGVVTSGTFRGIEVRSNSTATTCNVLNCSFYGNDSMAVGIYLIGAGEVSGVIRNNAVGGTTTTDLLDTITGTDNTTRDNNWTEDGSDSTSTFVPEDAWVAADDGDFTLTEDSELKDASAVTPIAYDIIGTARPQGAATDVGAFETIFVPPSGPGPGNRCRVLINANI